MAYVIANSDDAVKKAKENGWDVVLPQPNQLQIDIDNDADFDRFENSVDLFSREVCQVTETEINPSKSGKPGKRHITLTLANEVSHKDRILYQALLGSDRMRELLGFIRYLQKDPEPTLFFEKPL